MKTENFRFFLLATHSETLHWAKCPTVYCETQFTNNVNAVIILSILVRFLHVNENTICQFLAIQKNININIY